MKIKKAKIVLRILMLVSMCMFFSCTKKLTFEEKETLFNKYLERMDGMERIGYTENLNRVKENGYIHNYNTGNNENLTYEEYIDKALNEIEQKYPDIKEREGEDWEYVKKFFGEAEENIDEVQLDLFFEPNEESNLKDKYKKAKNMKEKAEVLKSISERIDAIKGKNEIIIKKWINDLYVLMHGQNNEYEIKFLELIKIRQDDVRFRYIVGQKLSPEKPSLNQEDYVKGYIDNETFYRNTNPIFDNDDENVLINMDWMYMLSSDYDYLNISTSFEAYEKGSREGCGQGKYLIEKQTKKTSDFNTQEDVKKYKEYITQDWPQFRAIMSEQYADEVIYIKNILKY